MTWVVTLVAAIVVFYAVRLVVLLRRVGRHRDRAAAAAAAVQSAASADANAKANAKAAPSPPRNGAAVQTMVVLGSGGHTTEMMALVDPLDRRRYSPVVYVYAASDERSRTRVVTWEAERRLPAAAAASDPLSTDGLPAKPNAAAAGAAAAAAAVPSGAASDALSAMGVSFVSIPRSREVYQSWFGTVFTTAYSLLHCVYHVWRRAPALLLCNGPGTCVPVAYAAFLFNWLLFRDCRIVFVESFCRAYSLSLSGRLLYPIASRFVVQWAGLRGQFPRSEYIGVIC